MKKDNSQERLHPIDEDRRLIEESIPIKEISIESTKEKNIRHGHISTLHIWWARRPLISARAAVFGSLTKYPYDSEKLKKLNEEIISLCKWENSNNPSIISKAKKIILQDSDLKKPKILDCFAGGGAIPLEAQRLGCESYAIDLNPVAHVIEMCTLVYPQKFGKALLDKNGFSKTKNKLALDVEKWGLWALNEAKKELGRFYLTDKDGGIPIAFLIARTIKCPNPACGAEIPLLKQYWVCNRPNKKISLKPIVRNKEVTFEIVENSNINFKPEEGTMKKGSAKCLVCGQTAHNDYVSKQAEELLMGKKITCVITSKSNVRGKFYRSATDNDALSLEKAGEELKKYEKKKIRIGKHEIPLIPNEPLPPAGSLGISPYWSNKKGQNKTWAYLFNERQLLSISTLLLKIREAKDKIIFEEKNEEYAKSVVSYLALWLGRYVDRGATLCMWDATKETHQHVFGRQALGMVWDYSEGNPFSEETGGLTNALDWIKRVILNLSDISEIGNCIQASATNQPYQSRYFDAVITDPPYYDAVPYSDLSDFFYVWFKRVIGDLYPEQFGTLLTPKVNEIIQTAARHEGDKEKAKQWYEDQMTKAFQECNRVLKDKGVFVVVFAHKSTSAWETLVSSLLNSNFIVTSSWPLKTEMATRLRARNSAALASSIFIVCRKRKSEEEGYFNEVKIELKERISKKLDQFWTQGIRGADFFISAIGPAIEVFGKYKKVRKLSGEEVNVTELLDLVREIVTDYSLQKILKGRNMGKVDDETRFYLLWRWAYDDNDIPYDDARKLAQALGTEADELLNRKDMLEKKGEKVNLMEPSQRKKNPHLGEPKGGLPASMIDVIHKACLLWEKQDKEELKEFIENSGYVGDDSLWNVAQAISEVLPEGNKEKQLIQGLLASKQSISKEINKEAKQGKLGEYMK